MLLLCYNMCLVILLSTQSGLLSHSLGSGILGGKNIALWMMRLQVWILVWTPTFFLSLVCVVDSWLSPMEERKIPGSMCYRPQCLVLWRREKSQVPCATGLSVSSFGGEENLGTMCYRPLCLVLWRRVKSRFHMLQASGSSPLEEGKIPGSMFCRP